MRQVYNYVTNEIEPVSEWSDETARRAIPQDDPTQAYYSRQRKEGMGPLEAVSETLAAVEEARKWGLRR